MPGKGGRPSYESKFTDHHWALLDNLCSLPMVIVRNEDILTMMRTQPGCHDLSLKTLQRIVQKKYKLSFVPYRLQKQGVFRTRIISKQFELAMKGNVGLLIWLGKQYCGQSDQPEPPEDPNETEHVVEFTEDADDEAVKDPAPEAPQVSN